LTSVKGSLRINMSHLLDLGLVVSMRDASFLSCRRYDDKLDVNRPMTYQRVAIDELEPQLIGAPRGVPRRVGRRSPRCSAWQADRLPNAATYVSCRLPWTKLAALATSGSDKPRPSRWHPFGQ
jgi:hypothetical protein